MLASAYDLLGSEFLVAWHGSEGAGFCPERLVIGAGRRQQSRAAFVLPLAFQVELAHLQVLPKLPDPLLTVPKSNETLSYGSSPFPELPGHLQSARRLVPRIFREGRDDVNWRSTDSGLAQSTR